MAILDALTYGCLFLAVISLWLNIKVYKNITIWHIFTIACLIFAFFSEIATLSAIFYTTLLGYITWYYYRTKHISAFIAVIFLSIPLTEHFNIPGFKSMLYLDHIIVSEKGLPYSLYLNLDKTLVGIFIVGFGFKIIDSKYIKSIAKSTFFYFLIASFTLLGAGILTGFIQFDPKVPGFIGSWIIVNLFSTCLAEEALYRKLIQEKLCNTFKFKFGYLVAIFLSAILFGLSHYEGGIVYIILASVAGVFYGFVYFKTKSVESSMLVHFMLNLTHLLCFTYPGLA